MADQLDVTVIVAEFPTPAQAVAAYEDLGQWISKGNGKRNVSTYRVVRDGEARLVVAVALTETGHKFPIVRRLKRRGGELTNLPAEAKRELVERALVAMEKGLSVERRGMYRPLDGAPPDASAN